jgi:hypothetical protein
VQAIAIEQGLHVISARFWRLNRSNTTQKMGLLSEIS